MARALANLDWPKPWLITTLGRDLCDLASPGSATAAIALHRPGIVINAAAYTAVDKAEGDAENAFALNSAAPREMATATAAAGIPLLHISTDYVFDGRAERPYWETDLCSPLSVYGKSKLEGEVQIREHQPAHVILRTSWVFSEHGSNFVRTMLRLGAERDELSIVGDQLGGPTAACDIAGALARIAISIAEGASSFGTYHFAGAPFTSWHGFAQAIFERAASRGARVPRTIHRISTADYPTSATRPLNSRLDCGAIERNWGIAQPSWEAALDLHVSALVARNNA